MLCKNRAVKTFWMFIIKSHLNTDFSQICLSPNKEKSITVQFFPFYPYSEEKNNEGRVWSREKMGKVTMQEK